MTIQSISAITLATHDMARAVRFYRLLGFELFYGGDVYNASGCVPASFNGPYEKPRPSRLVNLGRR